MKLKDGREKMTLVRRMTGVSLVLMLAGTMAWAQAAPADREQKPPVSVQTFYLTNVSQSKDAVELTTALRNLVDARARIYLVPSENAIVMEAPPDQLALARRLLDDLDRPKKTYRLTYTIADMDGDKRIGVQHYAMVVVTGQRTLLKQGSRVPVSTGQGSIQYVDIGMNFDASLDEFANGVRLRTKVEQSSIADEKSGMGSQTPVTRQMTIEGTAFVAPGKPLILGSLDVPGSTRHTDISVVMDLVK